MTIISDVRWIRCYAEAMSHIEDINRKKAFMKLMEKTFKGHDEDLAKFKRIHAPELLQK